MKKKKFSVNKNRSIFHAKQYEEEEETHTKCDKRISNNIKL